MTNDESLDKVVKLLEKYRKMFRFGSVTVDIKHHGYVGVRPAIDEYTPIEKGQNERIKRDKRG